MGQVVHKLFFIHELFRTCFTSKLFRTCFTSELIRTCFTYELIRNCFTYELIRTCFTYELIRACFNYELIRACFAYELIRTCLHIWANQNLFNVLGNQNLLHLVSCPPQQCTEVEYIIGNIFQIIYIDYIWASTSQLEGGRSIIFNIAYNKLLVYTVYCKSGIRLVRDYMPWQGIEPVTYKWFM